MLDLRRREVIAVLSGVVMILPLGARERTASMPAAGACLVARQLLFVGPCGIRIQLTCA
jgi:hypothetical protein